MSFYYFLPSISSVLPNLLFITSNRPANVLFSAVKLFRTRMVVTLMPLLSIDLVILFFIPEVLVMYLQVKVKSYYSL